MSCSVSPLRFSLIKLSYFKIFINIFSINPKYYLSIFIHFLVGLCNNKCFFSFSRQNQKLNRFFFCSLRFTIICNHLSALWNLTLCSENMFSFFWIIKMVQINSYYIFPIISSFISTFCFFKVIFGFSRLCNHYQNGW